jgi:hypothetical protein
MHILKTARPIENPIATTSSKLARSLCEVLRGGSTMPLPCWLLLDAILAALELERSAQVDDAISYAVQRGWLEAAGQPVHSLTITSLGLEMLKPRLV